MKIRYLLLSVLFFNSVATYANPSKTYGITVDNQKVCPIVKDTLGQLLFITVDGYGLKTGQAIHPDYVKLVKLLNIGGVRPRFSRKDAQSIIEATDKLFKATPVPLFIGVDVEQMTFITPAGLQQTAIGLDAGGSWLRKEQTQNSECFEQHTFLDAFLHKMLGVNLILGPSVDQNKRWNSPYTKTEALAPVANKILNTHNLMGVKTALKHFPYTPVQFNWRKKSVRPHLKKAQVMKKLAIFKQLANRSDFVITSHLFNNQIDKQNIATLSNKWLNILREDIGFKGLVLSDATSKVRRYDKTLGSFTNQWLAKHPDDDPVAVFAARTLLAGHDMVFVEGVARDTITMYEQLSVMACRDDIDGRRLQNSIAESYERISQYKKNNRGALSYRPKAAQALINDALSYNQKLNTRQCKNMHQDKFEFLQLKQRILEVR